MPLHNFTTYQAGVLQARAYRNLREFMSIHLKEHNNTMMEWALVGLVYDYTSDGGARVGQLANIINVEISLVTNMLNNLEARDLITRIIDPADRRARRVVTTRKAEADVKKIEKKLGIEMRKWLGNVSVRELQGYVKTLQNLATS